MTNKLVMMCIALVMLGGAILLIYLKWFDNPSPESMTTLTAAVTPTTAGNATMSTLTTIASTTAAANVPPR